MDTAAGRFSLDDLRRLVVAVLTARGWTAVQAGALASYLLWLDTVEASERGVAALPELLDEAVDGKVKPGAAGRLASERSSAVVLHAESAAPALVLGRAGEVAAEKARETGVGLVRVVGLSTEPLATAPIVAEIAVGPYVGLTLGPGASWAAAIPTMGGLPAVLDTALGNGKAARRSKGQAALRDLLPAAGWLAGGGAVVVGAIHVGLFDDGARFEAILDAWHDQPGLWLPARISGAREAAIRDGIAVRPHVRERLSRLAESCGVPALSPTE